MKTKNLLLFSFLMLFLLSFVAADSYVISNPVLTNSLRSPYISSNNFYNSQCTAGQDFILQVAPQGCTPTVVRSDLLESQKVPVFCPIVATKVNPLININSIQSISFLGGYPQGVQDIGFQQNYAALGNLNSKAFKDAPWAKIGYATIVLSQTQENQLKNCHKSLGGFAGDVCWIEGNLTAKLNYDLDSGMGIRSQTFFLPILSDTDFNDRLGQYSFFNNNGFVRATSITPTTATIGVYSGLLAHPYTPGRDKSKQMVGQYTLNIGQNSPNLYLPGLQCLSSVNVKLNSITYTDTVAQIEANSAVYQLRVGQSFLDKKCVINKIDYAQNYGINQQVQIHCDTDDKRNTDFSLFIQPKIELRVGGVLGDYSVGDAITNITNKGVNDTVYLAYANNIGTPQNPNLKVYLIALNGTSGPKLSSQELALASNLANDYNSEVLFSSFIRGVTNALNKWKGILGKKQFVLATSNNPATVVAKNGGETTISVIGFGNGNNVELAVNTQKNYSSAISNYTRVTDSYRSEKYSTETVSLGEQAYLNEIKLANSLKQKHDVQFYCKKLFTYYPNSTVASQYCSDSNIANSGISSKTVLINGVLYELNFDGVIQPSKKDYSGTFVVSNLENKTSTQVTLGKNEIYYLPGGKGDSIQLNSLGQSSAGISVSISQPATTTTQATFSNTNSATLQLNKPQSFPGIETYSIALTKVNLARVANVVVSPTVADTGSRANFSFKVAVEKRAIQLSPDRAKSLASKVNKTINALSGISKSLGTVVKGMQDACLATGAVLTLKNLVTTSGSEIQARQHVMKGWESVCQKEMTGSNPKFTNLDACYYSHTKEIDNQVGNLTNALKKQSENLAKIKSDLAKVSNNPPTNQQVLEKYSAQLAKTLGESQLGSSGKGFSVGEKKPIDISKITKLLDDSSMLKEGGYSMQELQNLETNLQLYKSNKDVYGNQLYSSLDTIQVNGQRIQSIMGASKQTGINPNQISEVSNPKSKTLDIPYLGLTLDDVLKSQKFKKNFPIDKFDGKTPVLVEKYNGEPIVILLKSYASNYFLMRNKTHNFKIYYAATGEPYKLLPQDVKVFESYNVLKNPTTSTGYQIINPKVQYYETGSNPLPAIVPFDAQNGWYAFMPQSSSSTPSILQSYDSSGKLESFQICRVGSSGVIDPSSDSCTLQILSNSNYGKIPSLDTNDAKRLVDEAVASVAEVSKAHTAGIRNVRVNLNGRSQTLAVGSPMAANTGMTCAEVMSPKDCQILFNVCDPVICPPSRCNYGGEYNVQDVIQSGIIGSIMLCLPNVKEGIKVPVCLTGVKAGIDGLTSTLKSYRDCLTTNANTGQNLGICDEMNSIYMCQFLWKQALPLTKIGITKLIVAFKGGTRGGGEYASIQSAFNNAKDSINYFTSQYASSNFKFLKTGSQGTAGANICDNFISVAYPSGQGLLNVLGTTESPPQYTANFQEIPLTTTTNPPTSQYNVYYNIYSGKNQGAYFQVYLQGSKSYYQDSSSGRLVASGYIGVDNYSTQKIEFTAPAGYTNLCIQVNGQEKCGFKEVSTSFAKNYLSDQYIKKQATQEGISTTSQCVSGSVSSYSLLNLNLQDALSNTVNPSISKYGIIRTCSTQNPGMGTDTNMGNSDQRWVSVGTCDGSSMQCWLDTQSVRNAVNFQHTANQVLNATENSTAQKNNLDAFFKSNGYLDMNMSLILKSILTTAKPGTEKAWIAALNLDNDSLISKMFYNSNKGKLFLVRGDILGNLSKNLFKSQESASLKSTGANNPTISLVNGARPIKYSPLTIQDVVNDPNYYSFTFSVDNLDSSGTIPVLYTFNHGKWYWSYGTDNNPVNTGRYNGLNFSLVSDTSTKERGLSKRAILLNKILSSEDYLSGLKSLMDLNLDISVPQSTGQGGFTINGMFPLRNYFGDGIFEVGSNNPNVIMESTDYSVYLRMEENNWFWNANKLSQADNKWASLSKAYSIQNPSILGYIKGVFTSSPSSLAGSVSKIPEQAKPLMKNLFLISSDESLTPTQQLEYSEALIFSNETVWNQVGQFHATGDFTPTTVKNYLTFLNTSYNSQNGKEKELIVNITQAFVKDLISKKFLAEPENKYFLKNVPNYTLIKKSLNFSSYVSSNPLFSSKINVLGADKYASLIKKYSSMTNLDANLLLAVIQQESNFNPNAVSNTGCKGLMQFCAGAAYDYGLCDDKHCAGSIDNRFDAEQNIAAGAKYLSNLNSKYSSYADSEKLALAAYNGGQGVIDKAISNIQSNSNLVGVSINPTISSPLQTTVDWQTVSSQITPSLLQSFSKYKSWSQADLDSKVNQIVTYVSKVENYKTLFAENYVSSDEKTSCPLVETPDYLGGITDSARRVLTVVNKLNGKVVPKEAEAKSCWDSVEYIYRLAGVNHLCQYSDSPGKRYDFYYIDSSGDHSGSANIGTSPYIAASTPLQSCTINRNNKITDLSQSKKLSSISPGDILSLVWEDSVHNVIFLNWVNGDSSDGLANVFSWYCPSYKNGKCPDGIHKYEEREVNISDEQYPVYMFWSPTK